MAAFGSGAAAAGKPRVGLSKRHAGQSGGRRLSGAAAASGGARSGGGRPATAASGGSKKRSSLGIARYFQMPAAAGPSSQTGRDTAATQPHLAAAAPGDAALTPQGGIQQSITQAMSTLGQQLQQRQQQQQEEKQQLLQQLTSQRQHQQQEEQHFDARQQPSRALTVDGAAADGAFCLPPAKRHRSSGDVDPGAAAAVGAADIDGYAAAGAQDLSLPTPSLQPSTAREDLFVGAGADDASMSLGLGSSAALAEGSSSGADLGASQEGGGLLDSPSILCSSGGDAMQAGCGARRSRGAAVSALSALFTGAGFGAALGDSIDPGTGHAWGSSQPLLGSVEAGSDPGAWELPMNGSTAGGFMSQAADPDSTGLLGNGSDTGGSLDGCGSSGGLSFGQLGTSSAALPDGTASVSFDQADGAAFDVDAAGVGGVGGCSSSSLKRFKQCLGGDTSQGRQQQQQQETPMELTRSSFFSQQQQPSTARRHSRFREQLLRSTADILTTDSPDAAAADAFEMLHDQQQQQQPGELTLPRNHAAMCDAGAVLSGTQARQQQRLSVHVSDSSDPSSGSGSISNDENADTGADAAGLEHLGITHIRKYAKLAHKVVKTVAKQQLQQQQHAPLAPRPGALNTQPQPAVQQLKPAPGQPDSTATAADGLDGSAVAPAHRMRLQLGLSRGGLLSGRKGPKAKGAAAGTGSFAAKLAGLRYDASMFVPLEQGGEEEEEEGTLAGAAAEEELCVRGSTAAAAARKPFKAPWLPAAATGCPSSSDDDLQVADATATTADRPGRRDRTGAVGFGAFADFACDDDSAGGVVQKRGAAFTWR